MDPEFWLARWQEHRIGFHLPEVNARLVAHADVLAPAPARVFVPLCGKSVDMAWLHAQGYSVVGVELSERALREFFDEQGLAYERTRQGALECFSAPGFTLFCGDFFALSPELLAGVQAFYDRAALVALPPALRPRYAQHLSAILPQPVIGLLVSFEYDQAAMNGPPFAVLEAELRALFEPAFRVQPLATYTEVENAARFRDAGVPTLSERVYKLERPARPAAGET